MGKLDILTRNYLSQNEIFADAFNYLMYNGRKVIDPRELREQDPTEMAVIRKLGRTITDQKIRDILKLRTIRHSKTATLVLLGIEGQSEVHYAMPVKDYLYDALNYAAQVENTRKKHRESADTKSSAEFLSGFTRQDHLVPVITLCICFSKERWDAPRSLHEMFDYLDPETQKYVNDYKLNLITPSDVDDYEKFSSELGLVLEFIHYSEDRKTISDIINMKERYKHVDISSVEIINAYTSASISIESAEGGQIDMCTAIKELIEEGRQEGLQEGRQEGLQKGRQEGLQEGLAEGISRGEDMLADLILKLTPGSAEYMEALQGTPEDRKRLYKKYRISEE